MGQTGRFYGKIVDAASGKAIPGVSIQLVSSKFNLATKKMADTLLTGQLTPQNGNFSLEGIPVMGEYKLKISAIGYKPFEQKVSFLTPEMQDKIKQAFMQMAAQNKPKTDSSGKAVGNAPAMNPMEALRKAIGGDMSKLMNLGDKDLGNIKLELEAKELENVTVTGNKPMIQMGIDRRIFNVDRSLAASGSTGIDILRQIPTVNVDIDGNVTVRNSLPTLFVDGRPTTLTLEQIPADDIQSVELITNPSAKYDASGGRCRYTKYCVEKEPQTGLQRLG